MIWLDFIILPIVALLIVVVALQSSKTNAAEALSGTSSDLFKNQKERGTELLLSRVTLVLSILFITTLFARMFMS